MGQLEGMTHEQRITMGLSLVVSAKDGLMAAFGAYLTASKGLEDWLFNALAALTILSTLSQRVGSGAARAAGITPDPVAN